jgi:hypothetical protein
MKDVLRSVLWFAVASGLWTLASADATPPPWSVGVDEAQKAAANRLLGDGNALFLDKKYVDALAKYREAVAVWDHPAIRFNIVRCLIQLDRALEAEDNLQRALRYGAAPLEAAVYTEALAYEKLLAKQVGDLAISCRQEGVQLTLDGQRIATCPARAVRRLSPGKHQLLGTGDGMLPRAAELVVIGGESQAVEVTLDPIPPGAGTRGGLGPRSYGKLALFGGAGLVAVAGGLGLWAWRTYRGQFPEHCMESPSGGAPLCDASGADVLARARFLGDTASVVAAVGGVGIVTGAILLWRYPTKEHSTTVTPASKGLGLAISGTF